MDKGVPKSPFPPLMSLTPAVGPRRIRLCFLASLWILGLTWAVQAAPVAPSHLHAVVIQQSPNNLAVIRLFWNDNSVGETGFRFRYTADGGAQQTFDIGSGSFSGTTGALASNVTVGLGVTYVIDVSAFDGSSTSAYSGQPITIVTAPFNAPVIKGTSLRSDGSVLMLWSDNSYAEAGYLVEMREQSVGSFLPVTPPEVANQDWMLLPVMKPGVRYEVRMRAYQGAASSPSAVTAYSNVVLTDVIPGLVAPSNLVVTATDETSVSMTLQDNSANAIGYEVEISYAGMNQYSEFATIADPYVEGSILDTLAFPDSVPPGTALDFRVRSFFQETQNGPRTYSPWSPTGTVTTPFYAPTNFSATASASPYHITFNWTDTSRVEEAYELQFREAGVGGLFYTRKYITGRDLTSPYQTSYADLPGFKPGTTYEFRLRSVLGDLETAYTSVATVTTPPGFSSPLSVQVYVNVPFTWTLSTLSQTTRTGISASSLPAGVSLAQPSNTAVIGTITTPGVYTFPLTATFQGGATHQTTMTVRAIHMPAAPLMPTPVPDQTLTLSTSVQISLQNYFSDPDSESVLRLHTNLGDVDLLLHQTATPQTVANFLSYVNSGRFDGALFHRSEDQFVFQGGGYKVNGSNWFEPISTFAPVPNEPGLQNAVGTVAMAKLEDLPHSATSQFFFNLNDNQANLDFQNDGFTVFARVGLASYPVLTQMALAPVGDYNVPVQYGPGAEDIFSTPFYNLPLTAAPPAGPHSLDLSKLIKISSTESVPAIVYEIVTPPNAAVAIASVESGSTLKIVPVAPGITTVRVSAVDRDGQATAHTLNLNVTQTFAEWASRQSLSGSDALVTGDLDKDGLSALEEFAFMGDPTKSLANERPVASTATSGGGTFLQVTFPVRHQTTGLTYVVEGSSNLAPTGWVPVWTSSDGLAVPAVVGVVPGAGFDTVTVRDSVSTSATDRRFLRVRLVVP